MEDPRLTQSVETNAADQTSVPGFSLRVLVGPDQGACYRSRGDKAIVGTHKSADMVLTDPTLSRFHCEIAIERGGARIRDLDSLNGTVIDGTQVLVAYLKDGATLRLGHTEVRFEFGTERIKIQLSDKERFGLMVGHSHAMRATFALLERAVESDVTVLLQGETGSGKDVAAESLHQESARSEGPFVVVDCGALPENLIESELFGHERGAFTGASATRVGAFESATGGTLFLDEIGELSVDVQPKLLRAIEAREVQRVGGSQRIPVDVRLIAATNRNLRAEVNARRFRSDLYFRLAVLVVTIPPLRQRTLDIPLLVDVILQNIGLAGHPAVPALKTPKFLDELARHSWPGNVRELRNHLETALAMEGQVPTPADGAPIIDPSQPLRVIRERWVQHVERQYIEALLRAHDGNISAAARAAGVARVHLYRLMTRVGLR